MFAKGDGATYTWVCSGCAPVDKVFAATFVPPLLCSRCGYKNEADCMSLLFLFLDGVGLAPASDDNPLANAPMPQLHALLGGPLILDQQQAHGSLLLKGIDATLGVPGLPQSGTGQTTLLAGFNAAELHGHHQPHFPPVALRPLLAERSILRRTQQRGGRAVFANAFGDGYWEALAKRRIRRTASVIAAEGAELRFRDIGDLRAGRALSWDMTNRVMAGLEPAANLPILTPQQAGANFARLALDHDLVFYENFMPDLAGHGRLHSAGTDVVEGQIMTALSQIDSFIGGVLGEMRATDTLLISSDHGNVESLAAPAHTRNPVPLLVVGAQVEPFRQVESLIGVADAIMQAVGLPEK
jgi:2,3-bisphosphoglycerate-independent phosphoglycerate mutase